MVMDTGFFCGEDKKQIMMMIAQLCEYTKNHWVVHFDGNVSYILTKQSSMRNKRWI